MRSRSYIATPPGVTITEQLSDRGMSQKEFAARMDMSEKHISKLVNGEVRLTPETAVKLEMVLGVPAGFWNNLEAIYREKLVKIEMEKKLAADEELARQFPYSEMAKYGWISPTRDIKEKAIYLRKYFEIVELSLLDNRQITHITCRRLAITDKSDLAILAWAQEAKIRAREIHTETVNVRNLLVHIPEIRSMTKLKPEQFIEGLNEMLSQCGIALVFLPHLKESYLQGATFKDGSKIVLGLTARGKDADIFWFSLFHELGHIVLGHIDQTDGTSQSDEEKADEWARNELIPLENFKGFLSQKSFSAEDILQFAENAGIAPGIVVGRLQHEKYIRHNELNNLKEQYEFSI